MARSTEVVAHWHHSVENFSTSSLEFYAAVKAELETAKAPVRFEEIEWNEGGLLSAKRRYLRIEFNRFVFDLCAAPFGTSYFFSWWLARRVPDLAAVYGCAGLLALPVALTLLIAVFGFVVGFLLFLLAITLTVFAMRNATQRGLQGVEDAVLAIPVLGGLYERFIQPVTYFSVDSRIMFEEAVHGTMLKIIEGLLAAKGARALSPEEARPQSRELLR